MYRYMCVYMYICIHIDVCVCFWFLSLVLLRTRTHGDAPPSRQELSDSVALGYADLGRLYIYIYVCVYI